MCTAIVENCRFIPCRKCRWTIDQYDYKKPKSTDAAFCKNRFYDQNLQFVKKTMDSLSPEADKNAITCNAYKPYTCSTKVDISACLPAAFSSRYCNLRGSIKIYMIFCFVLFLLSWFWDRNVANRINFILKPNLFSCDQITSMQDRKWVIIMVFDLPKLNYDSCNSCLFILVINPRLKEFVFW